MDIGPPTEQVLDVARFVNPFLNSPSNDVGASGPSAPADTDKNASPIPPFLATDAALMSETEKDLLVLLYYCHVANIRGSPDEVVSHLCNMAAKYGTIKDLDVRMEPLSETEVCTTPTHKTLLLNYSSLTAL
jgi:hypothetical protein